MSTPKKQRVNAYLIIKVGDRQFSSLEGQVLAQPYIKFSTLQYSEAKVVINDPKDDIRKTLTKETGVEIEIGEEGEEGVNVFKGKIWAFCRIPPNGTLIEAVDESANMQETGSSVNFQTNTFTQPPPLPNSAIAPASQPIAAQTSASGSPSVPEKLGLSSFDKLTELMKTANQSMNSQRVTQLAGQLANGSADLRFVKDSATATDAAGSVRMQQPGLTAATTQAAMVGDVVIARGNNIRQHAPGSGTPSGVVLDVVANPDAFIRWPKVTKRTGMQLAGPGSTTVLGWSPNDKQVVGATVVTSVDPPAHPTGVIQVPQWGSVKLSDPIVPGGIYTWGDATKNGTRVPTHDIMERIAVIAAKIEQLTKETGGRKWRINSWYRTPQANRNAGGASNSRHLYGDAVDVFFPGYDALHKKLYPTWPGGLAISHGSFLHLDARDGRSRWTY